MASSRASTLRIQFAEGERPHVFWISRWQRGRSQAQRYKVLSKRLKDGTLDVWVIEESISGARRRLARETVPADLPAGWLTHWVSALGESLGTSFSKFDLSRIQDREEWRRVARDLGWTRGDSSEDTA
ncbi:MAG: hypothetical protein GY725_21530 [bacterium]|nr:hypothetical protein [bacterium]